MKFLLVFLFCSTAVAQTSVNKIKMSELVKEKTQLELALSACEMDKQWETPKKESNKENEFFFGGLGLGVILGLLVK